MVSFQLPLLLAYLAFSLPCVRLADLAKGNSRNNNEPCPIYSKAQSAIISDGTQYMLVKGAARKEPCRQNIKTVTA